MKKLFALITGSIFLVSQTSFAVLSPFWQSRKEIETILRDSRLAERFYQGEAIEHIVKEGDAYWIIGKHVKCRVDVKYLPQEMPGPAQFELDFSHVIPNI